ncbi:kinetochore-associated protein NSL1 homolog [Dryobates pubescens]|uniref:kinetochore-associated protein NSL1 homolog n=1 Tax=Dryobates pubescens TaxID=118200 RepID=UPI0023B96C2E|nr:kinetochore-associated protein NSL1 homolog [Dryobates pubescens]
MARTQLRGKGGDATGSASGPAFFLRPRREMAAGPAVPLLLPPPPGEKGAGPPPSPAAAAAPQDARVRCCSRRGLGELMALCKPFVRALAQGQQGESAAAGDAFWNFETAMRENVTINGQPWEETSGDNDLYSGSNMKTLDDQFEELIVETTRKRKQWPKKILKHAVQRYKAEQEMLKLYQPSVAPEDIRPQLSQDAYIADLKQMTEMVFKDIGGAMKSLPALIERAEGFSQVLTWQPTLELCRLRQEVFSACKLKQENNVQNYVAPAEVTPTGADTGKSPHVLLKRKRTASSPERRRYPLRAKTALRT